MHAYNPIEHVSSRVKSPDSLVDKVRRKGIGTDFDSIRSAITDIAGIRITCSFVDDAYRLSDLLTGRTTSPSATSRITSPSPRRKATRACTSSSRCRCTSRRGGSMCPSRCSSAPSRWISGRVRAQDLLQVRPLVPAELLAELKNAADTRPSSTPAWSDCIARSGAPARGSSRL